MHAPGFKGYIVHIIYRAFVAALACAYTKAIAFRTDVANIEAGPRDRPGAYTFHSCLHACMQSFA